MSSLQRDWFFYRTIKVRTFVQNLKSRVDVAGLILRSGATGEHMAAMLAVANLGDLVEVGPRRQHAAGISASGQRARLRSLLRGWKNVQPLIEGAKSLAEGAEYLRREAVRAVQRPEDFADGPSPSAPDCNRWADAADVAAAEVEEALRRQLDEIYEDLAIAGGARAVIEETGEVVFVASVAMDG